jgi:hypothetical protein
MQSIMGAAYPAPGINLCPAIVFAYLAAEHMCNSRAERESDCDAQYARPLT